MEAREMKGAQAILETLHNAGVDTLFANPGTSEMALVRALDDAGTVRGVLALFEGVVTGAADGYGRMAGKPAGTLLHLGPGLANGSANLHNARRARTPIVNIVGEHSFAHLPLDAPLTSDIETLARPVSRWVRTTGSPEQAGQDTAVAIAAARSRGGPVTLIVPADVAWSDGASPAVTPAAAAPAQPGKAQVELAASLIRRHGKRCMLLLGGAALGEQGVAVAARLAAATGVRLASETFNARAARGVGRPFIPKVPYFGQAAEEFLKNVDVLLLVEARSPVNFFGYPGRRGTPVNLGTQVITVAQPGEDGSHGLMAIADLCGAGPGAAGVAGGQGFDRPTGPIDALALAKALARQLPEGAVLCDESVTASLAMPEALAGAAPHDQLDLMGGAIGGALPLSTGAAIGAPDRKVFCVSGDGSALYTIQALWTQARENLDVTTVICANRSYAILAYEHLQIEGCLPGPKAMPVLSLDNPAMRFADLARGFGVEAVTVESAEALDDALAAAAGRRGPLLIEAVMAPMSLPPRAP
jgi:acetolactate synthase-1/2/3 large subunit